MIKNSRLLKKMKFVNLFQMKSDPWRKSYFLGAQGKETMIHQPMKRKYPSADTGVDSERIRQAVGKEKGWQKNQTISSQHTLSILVFVMHYVQPMCSVLIFRKFKHAYSVQSSKFTEEINEAQLARIIEKRCIGIDKKYIKEAAQLLKCLAILIIIILTGGTYILSLLR